MLPINLLLVDRFEKTTSKKEIVENEPTVFSWS